MSNISNNLYIVIITSKLDLNIYINIQPVALISLINKNISLTNLRNWKYPWVNINSIFPGKPWQSEDGDSDKKKQGIKAC